jgi:hypothetical protein
MAEQTYRQKCAAMLDRLYTKKELIWEYIKLAEKYDALVKETKQ